MYQDTYIHICDAFYNEIEIAMSDKEEITLVYKTVDEEETTKGIIDDIYQNNQGEFICLNNNLSIRLDKIIKFKNFFPDNLEHTHTFGFSEI